MLHQAQNHSLAFLRLDRPQSTQQPAPDFWLDIGWRPRTCAPPNRVTHPCAGLAACTNNSAVALLVAKATLCTSHWRNSMFTSGS